MCSPSVGRSSFNVSSDQRVDVDLTRLQRLLAGEGEQVPGQVGAAIGGFVDHLGDSRELRIVRDAFGQDSDGAGDDGQNIVEVMRDAAGQLADRLHLLGLAELCFRGALFRKVAADEEVASHRLRPCPHPGQRHGLAILVDIARLEVAHEPSVSRRPHLRARAVEIVGMDEFDRAMPDHFFRPVTQDGHRARADLNESSRGIRHQDEILRRLEDALALLDLLVERRLRPLALADVARGLGGADDLSRHRPDRGDAERDVHRPAVLVQPQGLVLLDRLTLRYSIEDFDVPPPAGPAER